MKCTFLNLVYIAGWIGLVAGVIMLNKYAILAGCLFWLFGLLIKVIQS